MDIITKVAEQVSRLQTLKEELKTKLSSLMEIPSNATLSECISEIKSIPSYNSTSNNVVLEHRDEIGVIPQGFHNGSTAVISDVERAKIIPENIKEGITVLGIQGSYGKETSYNYQQKTITPSAQTQIISADAEHDALSTVTVLGDINLIPENIKNGVDIFGVTGTHLGSGSNSNLYQMIDGTTALSRDSSSLEINNNVINFTPKGIFG